MKKTIIISLLALMGLVIAIFFSNEWNRAAFGSNDYIEKGTKFGITIGSPEKEAHWHLFSKGLLPFNLSGGGIYDEQTCHGHTYPKYTKVQAYADDSWRSGIICVASENGVVNRVSWHYAMFQP